MGVDRPWHIYLEEIILKGLKLKYLGFASRLYFSWSCQRCPTLRDFLALENASPRLHNDALGVGTPPGKIIPKISRLQYSQNKTFINMFEIN